MRASASMRVVQPRLLFVYRQTKLTSLMLAKLVFVLNVMKHILLVSSFLSQNLKGGGSFSNLEINGT